MSLYKDFYLQKPNGFLNMLSMFDSTVLFATVLSVCAWSLLGAFGNGSWLNEEYIYKYPLYTTRIQSLGLSVDVVLSHLYVLPLYLPLQGWVAVRLMFPPQCNKDQGEDTERQVKKEYKRKSSNLILPKIILKFLWPIHESSTQLSLNQNMSV